MRRQSTGDAHEVRGAQWVARVLLKTSLLTAFLNETIEQNRQSQPYAYNPHADI
jgi:hypothetical protein